MPIPRRYKGGGQSISQPDDYRVTVTKAEVGLTKKKDKKMLTVTFTTDDEKSIKAYYPVGVDFKMDELADLKACLGVPPNAKADALVGRRCGIAVGPKKPNEHGKIYMQVEGYAKESDMTPSGQSSYVSSDFAPPPPDDEIPF